VNIAPKCKRCGSTRIRSQDLVISTQTVLEWGLSSKGELVPEDFESDAETHYDSAETYEKFPYDCGNCGTNLTLQDLLDSLSPEDLATLTKAKLTI
jgi:hypothetical protein